MPLQKFSLITFFSLIACVTVSDVRAEPGLTIYNGNFAVVRDQLSLDLRKGLNEVEYSEATLLLEPDSVILRDRQGNPINILEQSYRNDALSQELLLSIFEGETIEFLVSGQGSPDRIVEGTIVRAQGPLPSVGYGNPYYPSPYYPHSQNQSNTPVIEVDGALRFGLPGLPLFPSLGDDTILKPLLSWKIDAAEKTGVEANLSYITGGLSWNASYNVVDSGEGLIDLSGWVTMENRSGKTFDDAEIKLMAGEVNKVSPENRYLEDIIVTGRKRLEGVYEQSAGAAVTERNFDEYHLYELTHPVTLKDQETKQVEFLHVTDVSATTRYVYDGLSIDWNNYNYLNATYRKTNSDFGTNSQSQVDVVREIKNTEENALGIPLPEGLMRFYERDDESAEFVGEDLISHTPSDETLKLRTGSAFDLVGERTRTDFEYSSHADTVKESFEVTLRNRKEDPVEIQVLEHMFRWTNWEIVDTDFDYNKTDSNTVEFNVPLAPGEEKTIHYSVMYSW